MKFLSLNTLTIEAHNRNNKIGGIIMGMGWKNVNSSRTEVASRVCKCGRGKIVKYEVEQESDYPPFERTINEVERVCETPQEDCESGSFF